MSAGPLMMPYMITPAVANEIIFSQVIWDFNTGIGLNGQLFDTNTFSGGKLERARTRGRKQWMGSRHHD